MLNPRTTVKKLREECPGSLGAEERTELYHVTMGATDDLSISRVHR